MIKKLTLMLIGIVVLRVASVSVLAEEPVNFSLTITDRGNWALPWVQAILVFPFDPVKEARGEKAIAKIDSPSDPVTITLPPGNYEVVLKVLKFGVEPMEISLGKIKLSANTVIDVTQAKIPFEVFIPW